MNVSWISRLHGSSFVLGAAAACVALFALGAGQADGGGSGVQRVLSDPHPGSVVRIVEGTPYTVPPDTLLTLKSFGSTATMGNDVLLKINGVDTIAGRVDQVTSDLGFPIVAVPGDVVSVEQPLPDPLVSVLALGYLTRL